MKTVEVVHGHGCHIKGDILRLSDENAQVIVGEGFANYVPKKRWKTIRNADIAKAKSQSQGTKHKGQQLS